MNATLRRDGSSKFAPAVRYGNFPSVSAGWRISQEGFMSGFSIINNLKFRAGYGIVGNDQIDGNNQYSFYRSDQEPKNAPISRFPRYQGSIRSG